MVSSRGLGDVYKRQVLQVGDGANKVEHEFPLATVDKARLVPKF
jgi:hypothetical protein